MTFVRWKLEIPEQARSLENGPDEGCPKLLFFVKEKSKFEKAAISKDAVDVPITPPVAFLAW